MKTKGFTLVELLIVMAVSAIAGVLLLQVLVNNNSLVVDQSFKISHGLNLNDISSIIENDIKSSAGVVAEYPDSNPIYITSDNTLIIKIPSINQDEDVIPDIFDHIVVAADSANQKVLRRITIPSEQSSRPSNNRVLTSSLSLIKFSYLDSTGVSTTPTNASKINYIVNLLNKSGLNNYQSSTSGEINFRNN
ncbi:type II secretion system protein [Candidatus Daviesbacteria bacterium]|nr:type II secretion system protein [Candidatus Daviesbacteria bacterium]